MRHSGLLIAVAALGAAVGQTGMETQRSGAGYPERWPQGPSADTVPDWAGPGRIRFSRWDGGRVETAKAMLSGWPGFNPPNPDLLYSMTNWYDPGTVRLARDAGLNLIWVTFSVGFSERAEAVHQQQVRRYIQECHRQGIRVMAYESIGNMFWEDMFAAYPDSRNWVRLGKDGKPVPYGAGDYAKMGRVTRYMADYSKPGWRALLKRRIDRAVEAGADGIMYDNNFGSGLVALYDELQQYATAKKKDLLLMGNFHADTYVLNRLVNCITTEDGLEPGIYSEKGAQHPRLSRFRPLLRKIDGGYLMNNMGLLRIHETLAQGWKPVMIENGHREEGDRLERLPGPQRAQLSLAESMSFGVGQELFVEGKVAHGLLSGDPEVSATWRAIGTYNRFFAQNEGLYRGARSKAPLAVLLDDEPAPVALLDALAARRVLFEVLYDHDVTPEALRNYRAVLPLGGRIRDRAGKALSAFAAAGGTIVSAANDPRPDPEELAQRLHAASGEAKAIVEGPPGVLYNITEQPSNRSVLVHLLNYTLRPVDNVAVTLRVSAGTVRLLSPDSGSLPLKIVGRSADTVRLEVPHLSIYSVLIAEEKR